MEKQVSSFEPVELYESEIELMSKDHRENHGMDHCIRDLLHKSVVMIKKEHWICNCFPFLSIKREELCNVVPKGLIAITRDFAIVLNDDNHLTLLGHNDDFKQLFQDERDERIVKIAASFSEYWGLTETGRVVTCREVNEFDRSCEIETWRGVKDITACEGHTVAVMEGGWLQCLDEQGGEDGVPDHANVIRDWHDIKQISVGFSNIMGLTKKNRVLYHTVNPSTKTHFYDRFNDVVQIDCYSSYYGNDYSMILRSNGTVSSDTFKGVNKWREIVQISVGEDIAVGLKRDGSLEMVDNRGERYEAKRWKNLVCVECKFFGVVGITRSGQILSLYS